MKIKFFRNIPRRYAQNLMGIVLNLCKSIFRCTWSNIDNISMELSLKQILKFRNIQIMKSIKFKVYILTRIYLSADLTKAWRFKVILTKIIIKVFSYKFGIKTKYKTERFWNFLFKNSKLIKSLTWIYMDHLR